MPGVNHCYLMHTPLKQTSQPAYVYTKVAIILISDCQPTRLTRIIAVFQVPLFNNKNGKQVSLPLILHVFLLLGFCR